VLERLEGLSQTPRGALVLREVSGLGYSAIGRVLGIPPATARRTVADARRVMTAARGRGDDGGEVREGDVSEDEVGEDELGEELDRRLPHLSEVLLSMALREGLARANARPNRAGSRAARRRMRRGLVATAVGAFLLVATVLGFTADRLSRPAKLSPPPALVPLAQLGAPGPLGGAELPSESGRHRDDRVGCDPEVETCDPDPPPDRDCPPNCPPPDRDCPPNCPPPDRDCPPNCPPPEELVAVCLNGPPGPPRYFPPPPRPGFRRCAGGRGLVLLPIDALGATQAATSEGGAEAERPRRSSARRRSAERRSAERRAAHRERRAHAGTGRARTARAAQAPAPAWRRPRAGVARAAVQTAPGPRRGRPARPRPAPRQSHRARRRGRPPSAPPGRANGHRRGAPPGRGRGHGPGAPPGRGRGHH
jgi:hypothetical protein